MSKIYITFDCVSEVEWVKQSDNGFALETTEFSTTPEDVPSICRLILSRCKKRTRTLDGYDLSYYANGRPTGFLFFPSVLELGKTDKNEWLQVLSPKSPIEGLWAAMQFHFSGRKN